LDGIAWAEFVCRRIGKGVLSCTRHLSFRHF